LGPLTVGCLGWRGGRPSAFARGSRTLVRGLGMGPRLNPSPWFGLLGLWWWWLVCLGHCGVMWVMGVWLNGLRLTLALPWVSGCGCWGSRCVLQLGGWRLGAAVLSCPCPGLAVLSLSSWACRALCWRVRVLPCPLAFLAWLVLPRPWPALCSRVRALSACVPVPLGPPALGVVCPAVCVRSLPRPGPSSGVAWRGCVSLRLCVAVGAACGCASLWSGACVAVWWVRRSGPALLAPGFGFGWVRVGWVIRLWCPPPLLVRGCLG